MHIAHDFSVRAIRENTASLPRTYTGKNCNISMNTGEIVKAISTNGETMLFSDMAITLCLSGEAVSETNFVRNRIIPGTLELFSPGSVFQVKEVSEDASFIGMSFTPFAVKEIFEGNTPWELLTHKRDLRILLPESKTVLFQNMTEVFISMLQECGEDSQSSIRMAGSLLAYAKDCFKNIDGDTESGISRANLLCRRFLELLGEAKGRHHDIGWFADKLCVSNHYLSVAIKKSSGSTVKELIDKSVIAEIKIRLSYSNLSVAQIAEDLSFASSSLMCNYFKSQIGQSPMQFRKQIHRHII